MRVKGIRVNIAARCSKGFSLNNIMNLSTLACIVLHALCVIKDLMRREFTKNIVIETAFSNESASMHFLPSDTATVDMNKY